MDKKTPPYPLMLALLILLCSEVTSCAQQAMHSASAPSTPMAEAAPADEPCVVPKIYTNPADWAGLQRYRKENETLLQQKPDPQRVVFLGSSTIDFWAHQFKGIFFPNQPSYVNRGMSGQTTGQMLLRFQQDVIALKPRVVFFLGGTNDVAGNNGPETLQEIEDNIRSMLMLAKANGITMVLASQLPVTQFPWNPACRPKEKLLALSAWERATAEREGLPYADLYTALSDGSGNFREGLSEEGAHPNERAYQAMTPVVEKAIQQALRAQGIR